MNYVISRPEGFIVNELPGKYGKGECTHFTLEKTGWNTIDVINELARRLHTSPDRFGYAGLKDKNAITTQRVSAWRVPVKRLQDLNIKGVKLSDFKEGLERITIGSHEGNSFIITLEEIKSLIKPVNVPNFFGSQRFGRNELLGEALINNDFKKEVDLLLENPNGFYESLVNKFLRKNPNDYVKALRQVDKKIRALWINAFQAKVWNNKVLELIKKKEIPEKLDLPSFSEIKLMPELGVFPGSSRDTIMHVKDYKAKKTVNGFILEFSLPKGSYATTLIDYVTGNLKI